VNEEEIIMGNRLKGKVAIVTGAGCLPAPPDREQIGNGTAAAILYAEEGAEVLAVDIKEEAAEETKRQIEEKGGICSVLKADVSQAQDCKGVAEHCMKVYGRIDILHNNVGIQPPKPGGLLELEDENWDLVMNVNLKSIFHTSRAVIPQMLKQGGGCILNVSSIASVRYTMPKIFIYTISKSAVNALTRCMAVEFAEKGIRVNCIMPGMIDSPTIYHSMTGFYDGDLEKMRKDRNERVPMKRMGVPWDIARAALFLASDDASYITGQILGVDGGLWAMGE
jgi:NAD(P)-dependent dehydrogenase (short-subunit alcohol dehydrogenase family)